MLVGSCAHPHNLNVPKRVLDQEGRNEYFGKAHHNEVCYYRRYKQIPELIDWTGYGSASYAMTTQFCNGGTLHTLLFHILAHASMPLAEIFIWKIFTQLLYTLKYLHHHRRSVVHLDRLLQNVFLDWEEQSLAEEGEAKHHPPDVYLGDFGLADEVSHPDFAPADLQMLHTLLLTACLGEVRNRYSLPGWQDRFPLQYSAEVRECLAILAEPWSFHGRNKLVKDVAQRRL
jgi:serine/threonine protein kinase